LNRRTVLAALVAAALAAPLPAQFMTRGPRNERPEGVDPLTAQRIVSEVGFDQRLGERLPLDAPFRDETGRAVRLGDYFGEKPVLLALVYFHCPMLCTMVSNGVASSFKGIPFEPAASSRWSSSASTRPTPGARGREEGRRRRALRQGRLGPGLALPDRRRGGDRRAHRRSRLPLRQGRDERRVRARGGSGGGDARRPAGALHLRHRLRPQGPQARAGRSLRGRIGGVVEKLLLLCYHYDTALGRYTAVSMLSLRIAAALTLAVLVSLIAVLLLRERRARRLAAGGAASV